MRAGGEGAPGAGLRSALRVIASALLVVLLAGPAWAQRAELARLEARAKAFYALVSAGQREKAAGEFPGLERELAGFVERLRAELGGMREAVMERDGDLEALYRSARWREPEIASLVGTYHLAWVRYQGAQLAGEAKRKKELLQQAVDGFSQFLLVDEVPEIYAECLYGRGLAFLDLGETTKAVEDLRAASETPQVGAKAKAALAEAQRRAKGGRTAEPAADTPETLLGRLGELLPRAAGGDAAAEKEAATLARGLAARGGDWPARVRSAVVARLGGDAEAIRSSFGLWLLAQLAVDRGRCAEVPPLAAAGADVRDAGRARHRPELLFLDAGCALNAGRQRQAADQLDVLLREHGDSPRATEAAYYRFRALDVARTADPALAPRYEAALREYLARFGKADGAAEARFLLGELERARGECETAEAEYARVTTGPFAARARLGALECRAGEIAAGGGSVPAERRRQVAGDLRDYSRATKDEALAARAAVLGALVASGGREPDHRLVLELTGRFTERYPGATRLAAQAARLRLESRVAGGDLTGAAADVDVVLAAEPPGPERRTVLARLARDLQVRVDRGPESDAGTLALARKVQQALVDETGDAGDRLVLAGLALRAGDAGEARRLYEAVLAADAGSAEARRGAARAAAAAGDANAALAYWRQLLEASPPGGTAWYEARLAQVTLLADDGRRGQACELLRSSRGRATSAGGDQLEARLRSLEPEICH